MHNLVTFLRKILLFIVFFVTPIFFLPITQEFFSTQKIYFGSFLGLVILGLTILHFIQHKTLKWKKPVFESSFMLIVLSVVVSIIIVSPNKIESLLNMGFGLLPVLTLFFLYTFSQQTLSVRDTKPLRLVMFSSLIVSLSAIFFYFNPFKNVNLPSFLNFLKSDLFSPVGSILDAAMLLGFFGALGVLELVSEESQHILKNIRTKIFTYVSVGLFIAGFAITVYILVRPLPQPAGQTPVLRQSLMSQMTPYTVSWFAAVEILKSPVNALFGVGTGNFVTVFTRVRPNEYNQTPFWNIQYGQSRSALLHVITELGVFGLLAFGLFVLTLYRYVMRLPKEEKTVYQVGLGILGIYFLLFPLSYMMFFLMTAYAVSLAMTLKEHHVIYEDEKTFDTSKIMPLYAGTIGVVVFVMIVAGYGLYRAYSAEIFFKQSLDGANENNAQKAYENNRKAIIANPYIERFRVNFSQLNLLIGNNIASKDQKDITEQDRQNITQAIQSAIAEAKAAVSLNPKRSAYWENLAVIYRNVLNIVEGADAWTISSYQRAIAHDPSNPALRIALGGVYYTLNNFEEASKLFEQAIVLKPDWANAYYNYAWAMYQRKEYSRAVAAMQNVLQLVDNTGDDYKRAEKDFEDFKKMLPEEQVSTEDQVGKQSELNLPTPPVATFSPKIELPKDASPGANFPN